MIAVRLAITPLGERSEYADRMLSVAIAVALHIGFAVSYALLNFSSPLGMPQAPAMIVELVPVPVAPVSQQDVALGPSQEAQPPPQTPRARQDQLEPSQKTEKMAIATVPVEPKPEARPETKPAEVRPPASLATAPPRAQSHTGPIPAAPSPGSNRANAVPASWINSLFSHLMRYRQYPSAAQAHHEEGVVTLSFTMDRKGHVLSRHIVRSSGYSALDEEAIMMITRAQPLPPFPPSMPEESRSFFAPIKFSLR